MEIVKEERVFRDGTAPRFFPVSTTDGTIKRGKRVYRSKRRGSPRNVPGVNMSSFRFIEDEEDRETAKTVAYAAMSSLSKTGTVVRATAWKGEYEHRVVICLGGVPIIGTEQIDAIRNSAIGRIRNVMYSVFVPKFADMKNTHDAIPRRDSWQYQNIEQEPHALGIETSVSIYIIRSDTIPDEKIDAELASSEEFRAKKRTRTGSQISGTR